jgi:hypothetical protein
MGYYGWLARWMERRLSRRQQAVFVLLILAGLGLGTGVAAILKALSSPHWYALVVASVGGAIGAVGFLIDRRGVDAGSQSKRQAALNAKRKARAVSVLVPVSFLIFPLRGFLPDIGTVALLAAVAGLFLPYPVWLVHRLVVDPEWFDKNLSIPVGAGKPHE